MTVPTIEPAALPVSLSLAVCGPSAPVLEVTVPLHWPRYARGKVAAPDEGVPLTEPPLAGAELDGVSVAAGDVVAVAEVLAMSVPDDLVLAVGCPPEPCSAVTAITTATAATTTVAPAPISTPRRRRGDGCPG